MKRFLAATLIAMTLVGCASEGLNQYSYKDVGQSTLAEFGTIITSRPINITGQNTGAGATAGGALGAAAGASLGSGNGQLVGIVGGLVVGAAAGAIAEQAAANKKGIEYTITKENGQTITIAQNLEKQEAVIPNGSRVMVQTSGSYQRVIPANHLPESIKRPKGIKVTD